MLSRFLNLIGSTILALACLTEATEDAGVIGTLQVGEELFTTVQILLHFFRFNLMGSIFLDLLWQVFEVSILYPIFSGWELLV